MCGIFGIVANEDQQLGTILVEAGKRLSYRGYDSVGCATIRRDGSIDLRKDVGKVDEVTARYNLQEMKGHRGIVQLRWATFGAPSKVNAQPHLDSDGDLVGAHNGNVVNNVELREQFLKEGMTVRSTNDGESCVHAVERYVNQGCNMIDAIRKAYNDLEGDYAFVIGKVGEDKLYAVKKGSGLVAGIANGFTCVSSDLPSLLPLTQKILRVQDGEIVILGPSGLNVVSLIDGTTVERLPEEIQESMESAVKSGYPHFMLKEIHEQPAVAGELLHLLNASPHVNRMVERMKSARHLYLVGCGTSYHACLLGAIYLGRLARRAAIPVLAPQFIAQYGAAITKEDAGVFVSQSGETKDVLNAVEIAQRQEMLVLGFVNVIGSTLMNVSERYLPLACGYEISVPATKTFMNQAILFLYLAMRMGGHSTDSLKNLPNLIQESIDMSDPQVITLSSELSDRNDLYCLGYGLTYPIALEGALKLKEVTYSHCEGMLSTEFKHGPLSAVTKDYPVIFVAGPEDVPLIVSGLNETTCRGGRAIVIGEEEERLRTNSQELISLPRAGEIINPLLAVIPLQLLAYRCSVARGYDPDFPRNLSKTLTVD
ncbi:glutamine--fructose-6-phosphate transaminase (isomerizing) [bacterium]|nr:glutamine--fructose-6-phosphate transaminase (isomerizing) [bacterium]MCI0603381.1 glutamine--fructose-6-phosphate transaminase (isomerizing) [bacterium]